MIINTQLVGTACTIKGPPVDAYHIQDMEGGLSYWVVQESHLAPPDPLTPEGMKAIPTDEPWEKFMRMVRGNAKEAV